MSTLKTSVCANYSYLVNDTLSNITCTTPTEFSFEIISPGPLTLELTPLETNNAKWNQLIGFYLKMTNQSLTQMSNIKVKINNPNNLLFIPASLRNIITNVVYDVIDSDGYYTIAEPINSNSSLTLEFLNNLSYEVNNTGYIVSPIKTTLSSISPTNTSNESSVNIAESKIYVTISDDKSQITMINKGTTSSAPFSYKYLPPANISTATFSGDGSESCSFGRLGNYFILRIGALQLNRPNDDPLKKLLVNFS